MALANWAGNHVYGAAELHRPATLEHLRAIVARAPRVRALGSRHSFSDSPTPRELVALDGLPADVVVDPRAGTVTCGAGIRYGELAEPLAAQGLALHNLASLPHISVGGAIATATHGSGDANGNLATAVARLELVTSDGDVLTVRRGDAGLRRRRRRPRRAGRGHARHPRRRARVRGAPARVRGAGLGRPARALRRHHGRPATASASSPAGARPSTRCGSRAA